ncbi:MAG: hypothetical protein JSV62_14290 [Promethearchaeota archaeon]|nr:MAG: hypothetical protein JSV62_14290 [Candidatus Lokiarchaeota archaeon]
MKQSEQDNLFTTFQQTIESVIKEKRRNPKNEKLLNNFNARIIIGLQIEEDYYFWVNLVANEGTYSLGKGKLDEYDLELRAAPLDLVFFVNGENSVLNMILKKNSFNYKKLRFSKGSTGKRNLGILLKLSKILVLD